MSKLAEYLKPVKKSGTLVANELIQERCRQKLPVTAFGLGQSSFPPIACAIEALGSGQRA